MQAVMTWSAHADVGGSVEFLKRQDRVLMSVRISGLKPWGVHGLHVHEYAVDVNAEDQGVGKHFDPTHASSHGKWPKSHVGDLLNNVEANRDGEIRIAMVDVPSLRGWYSELLGRSVVLHAYPDDSGVPALYGVRYGEMDEMDLTRFGRADISLQKLNTGSLTTGNTGPNLACGTIIIL
jgi:Cu-Zn family superoxide dismutase